MNATVREQAADIIGRADTWQLDVVEGAVHSFCLLSTVWDDRTRVRVRSFLATTLNEMLVEEASYRVGRTSEERSYSTLVSQKLAACLVRINAI